MKPVKIKCWASREKISVYGITLHQNEPSLKNGDWISRGWVQDLCHTQLGSYLGLKEGNKKKVTVRISEGWDDE